MRYYTSTAVPTSLVGSISSTATSFTVAALNGYPSSFPFTVALDPDTDNEELISVTGITGLVVTCTRGFAGTTAIGHGAGAGFEHRTSHLDYQEPQNHIAANNGVHGVTGNVVGTTDAQALTNKTIDGNSNTLTNVPSLAVVGLAASLAGKLSNPSTPWSKGSLLVGTGTGVYDTFPVGADGTVPTADSTVAAGISWLPFAAIWQSYTPSITDAAGNALTIGNGTLTGRYVQVGKLVTVNVSFAWGSTSSTSGMTTANSLRLTLPVPPVGAAAGLLTSQAVTSGVGSFVPRAASITSGNTYAEWWSEGWGGSSTNPSISKLRPADLNQPTVQKCQMSLTYEAA